MKMNSHDKLLDRCRSSSSYPSKFLRPGFLESDLKAYSDNLNGRANALFNPSKESLDFLEYLDGEDEYREKRVSNHKDLKDHILDNTKDPRCRYIFAQTTDSRDPLNCSRESFCFILTFHQASPLFLDYVHSFGKTRSPLDYSMAGFQSEDSLGVPDNQALKIPRLGRSGRELRLSYLLRSHEGSSSMGQNNGNPKKWSWKVRQMTVYHSFDLETGRALWISIKGNDIMKKAITEASKQFPELQTSFLDTVAGGFAATLATHLVFLGWCDGHWRESINDTKTELSELFVKAKTTNLDRNISGITTDFLKRAITLHKARSDILPGGGNISKSSTFVGSVRTRTSDMFSKLPSWPRSNSNKPFSEKAQEPSTKSNKFDHFEEFTFSQLQDLYHIWERLHEMQLVIQLDIQALKDIKECYENLMEREELPGDIKTGCRRQVAEFGRKVDRIRKNLEMRLTQLDSMLSWLNEGKTLFDGILQFRSVRANQIFAEIAHEQGMKMEKIANKTEEETGSMHIITFVTLAFLPGTFVAVRFGWPHVKRWISDLTREQTFFQSGLVSLNEKPTGIRDALQFKKEAFWAFLAICLPMMLVTFLLWLVVYKTNKKRSQRRHRSLEQGEV